MKAKKMISFILMSAAALTLLAGCGAENTADNTEKQNQDTNTVETAEVGNAETEKSSTASAEEGNILVVYYSATGNTEEVANAIAEATGGDIFELEPVEQYSSEDLDWTDSESRVSREYENEDLRDVELEASTVENWDSYDTVFIGYPIWWGIAAWPVDSFVEANDFTGKKVIPFATSSSSGMGDSGSLLEELAGTGDWQDGERFRSGASAEDVQEWVHIIVTNL
ncbi:MAG: flavodoxin [Lachnospiraceae bacterium]|nr:flavodoxin [Lachnospiraceae bacterium]